MVAMNEDLWMCEYNRTFDNELNNGLTETEAEALASESADLAVYYSKCASMDTLRSELDSRDLPITGRRSQLLRRILKNNTDKRKQENKNNNNEYELFFRRVFKNHMDKHKQENKNDPEIIPEHNSVLTTRRSMRIAKMALPYL